MNAALRHPIVAAGVVCFRGPQVLLIRRATPPLIGQWSIPGGRLGWGETVRDAALRELKEETGVAAELLGLIDVVDAFHHNAEGTLDRQYALIDFAARWTAGEPCAGDDASEAVFCDYEDAMARLAWDQTRRVLARARVMVMGEHEP